jgi:hypothetical protein
MHLQNHVIGSAILINTQMCQLWLARPTRQVLKCISNLLGSARALFAPVSAIGSAILIDIQIWQVCLARPTRQVLKTILKLLGEVRVVFALAR